MKIFSSFDTDYKHQLVQKKQEQYGVENVHLIEKSKLFLVMRVYVPLVVALLGGVITWRVLSAMWHFDYIWTLASTLLMIIAILIPYRIPKYYIDYHMDYCIITPAEVILSDQSGIFMRQFRTLDASKIKSIIVQKKNMFKSIWNNGMITFMSDGDENNLGEIQLDYIYNPEFHKQRITVIIGQA